MAQTQALVIYDAVSHQVLRVIVAGDDSEYARFHLQTVGVGEVGLLFAYDRTQFVDVQAVVAAAIAAVPQ